MVPLDDVRLDAALDHLPLASLPPGFVERTLSRVAERSLPRPSFLDFALPLFGATALLTLLIVWIGFASGMDPLWSSRLLLESQLVWSRVVPNLPPPDPALGLALAVVALASVALAADRRRLSLT